MLSISPISSVVFYNPKNDQECGAFSSKLLLLLNSSANYHRYQRKQLRTLMMSMENKTKVPQVLTVAGSDSGAGAGIQADLKTCAARGVYCSTVITSVTAQNTIGVQGVNIMHEDFVAEQLKSVLSDMQVDVVKTGMLPSISIVKVLCQSLREFPVQGQL
uniref:Uncharacterized protein MANES_10G122900 n=1 Tax=Rhizophora mucronata TaxID=61149 RepID=A0A2P2L2F4_RHIMU